MAERPLCEKDSLLHTAIQDNPAPQQRRYRWIVLALSASAAVFGTIQVVRRQQEQASHLDFAAFVDETIQIQVDNEYTLNGNDQPGLDYPWFTYLIEPYRKTTFSVIANKSYTGYLFNWHVNGSNFTGAELKFECTHPNKFYDISVRIMDGPFGNLLASKSISPMCKYVRREIRALSDTDRESWFKALEVVYSLPTVKGRAKYGSAYKSAEDFVRIHNTMSGHVDCDHLHGGLGFLPQHAAMTLSFERSLQSIDPQVTVAYWDYTIEGHAMMESNNSLDVWYSSMVWEDDWFGHYSPNGFAVSRGRFAYIPVKKDAWSISSVTNSYGLLRSPWNNNKIPYVTRHHKSYGFFTKTSIVPQCFNHYDQMQMSMFSQFGSSIQYAPHGSLHILAGGTWGADYRFYLQDHYDYNEARAQPLGTVTMARIWRKGWMTCPNYCAIDTPLVDCKCTCPDLEKWIRENQTVTMLENMYPGLASAKHFLVDNHGHDISEFFLRMLCNDDDALTPQIGDFMESASPSDPIFWPTHPTLDRLWVWRKINGFMDESWVNTSCWGHNEHDTTIWHLTENEVEETQYTNAELMTMFDPMLVQVPYIYDSFKWPHCEQEGYPLQLITTNTDIDSGTAPLGDVSMLQTHKQLTDSNDFVFLGWNQEYDFIDPAPVPMR